MTWNPCAGFYQIVVLTEEVYDLALPSSVRKILQVSQYVISLGIEGFPLDCFGAKGYVARLLIWSAAPVVLVLFSLAIVARMRLLRDGRIGFMNLPRAVAPAALRIIFLCYPVITNRAFEAFSCYRFLDGSSWLITDGTLVA